MPSPVITPSASFTRPANTTQYASGDLVANSTTAGDVAPMEFAAAPAYHGGGVIRRVRIHKSGTGVTAADFRLHLFASDPTATAPTNGDNGAFATIEADWLGAFDVTLAAFNDGAKGIDTPNQGTQVAFRLESQKVIYGLLEARGTYTPASGEVFTVTLEVEIN